METKTLHFKVGADFGMTLMQIAQEHLLYATDLDKALNVYTESLGGDVPEELALKLLSGEMLLLVDEKSQMFEVVERAKHMHLDDMYPKQIDFNRFAKDKQKELDTHVKNLDKGLDIILDIILNKFRYYDSYRLDIPIEAIMKYIYGNNDDFIADMLDELEYDNDVQQMKSLIRLTKDFIEKSLAMSDMIKRLEVMYGFKKELNIQKLLNLVQKVQSIPKAEFNKFTEGDDEMLASYMEASKEIDVAMSEGLKPVDIMSNYSAGWLCPEGMYYALNGEIANMLHIQIADGLMSEGLVPKDCDNPDSWLEQQGWVKIHGNNVQFAGCLNNKLIPPQENVHMTDTQKKIIYEYIMVCHGGIVRAGWKLEKISAVRFRDTDNIMLAKDYFSYD